MGGRTGPLRRADRLLRSGEFQHVTQHGRRAAVRGFVVLVAPSACGDRCRLGVTVSRRVGNAVVRNRVKRRIREWFRRVRTELRPGIDLVVIGRREAARQDAAQARVALCEGARQAGACAR